MMTVILAGGLGTRLGDETRVRPKPMIEIGGKPLVWHIMSIFASYGYREFILALGYLQEVVKEYFLRLNQLNADLGINLASGEVCSGQGRKLDWGVHLVYTGMLTATGGRLKRLAPRLTGCGDFLLTYGDGVGDINIEELVRFHRSHGKLATVTAVRAPERFGRIKMDGDLVADFEEKPPEGGDWINGGFFVLNEKALDYIGGDETSWETEPLERLVMEGQLAAYRHEGFWSSVNTPEDKAYLEQCWRENRAQWKSW
ncbi:MAG: glucose-1-phosphate cytidylyltransferase [Acidimicrobiia bacterium]|nr:glucose-1-phosphate cytidylyltransferase [Acidimicrobiia bacterium]